MSEVVRKPKFSYENFVTDNMSDFWDRVSEKRGMEIILNMYIEMSSVLLRKLYQINSETSLEDIVPFNIHSGMIINLDRRQNTYTRIEVPTDEPIKEIPEVHSNLRYPKIIYHEGEDYEVIEDDGDIYIDFGAANPEVLRTLEVGTDNNPYIYFPVAYAEDQRIFKNYGEAVNLEPRNREGEEGIEDEFYRNGVQALWKAMYTGPTISSIRQAMYVLHGLPFNQEAGVVVDTDRVGLLDPGAPEITIDGQLGRDSFTIQLREEDIIDIQTFNNNDYAGFDVSDKNIRTFESVHDVNVIEETMLDDEDLYKEILPANLYRYDASNEIFYIRESELVGPEITVSADEEGYFFDQNYDVLRNDPNTDGQISIERDLSDEWIRVFYNHRKTGEVREYELPDSLTIHEDIEVGDFLEKFTLFSPQLEIQDYATDGETRGTTPGKKIWIQNLFPFGQFTVRSGQELDVQTVVDDVTEFLDFLKPAYSDYTFQLQINPTNAHVFGRIFPDDIIVEMVEETNKEVINLGDIGRLSNNIYNAITFVGDQREQAGYNPIPMWDQQEYFNKLLSEIQAGEFSFEDGFYNLPSGYDSHIEYMNDQGFFDGFQFWEQGVIAAQTMAEAEDLAEDLDGVTAEEIFYPPEHPDGQLVVDETKIIKWDIGHIEGDNIIAWDDPSIAFDEGLDQSQSDEGLPEDYDEDDFTWKWDAYSANDVVANRGPFTYIFDEVEADLGPVIEGLWDDINTFYDLRDIFVNRSKDNF